MKTIDFSILNGKKIYVATPMYGGFATSHYVSSIIELTEICAQNNIEIHFAFLSNESLITRARNVLVSMFLKTDCDYLFFIDADIGFNKEDFLYMISKASTSDIDILCAAYPKKRIAWERIEKARKNKLIKNEQDYVQYSGVYGINFTEGQKTIKMDQLNEVTECSTGFMLISKKTFINLKNAFPENTYISDNTEGSIEEIFAYFDAGIDKDTNRYLSEDYMFCKNARKIGIKILLAPWIKLVHVGTTVFSGTYEGFLKVDNNKN